MHRKFLLVSVFSFFLKLFLPTVIAQPIDLRTGEWKFSIGDNKEWSKTNFDDADWQNVQVGVTWESFLNRRMDLLALDSLTKDSSLFLSPTSVSPNYDGLGWYRKKIIIPQEWKRNTRKAGGLVLKLGKIDDADETFFNGIKIGSTGKMPPENVSAWDTEREYTVPYKLVKWNEVNTIAVRVSDTGGGGGMYEGEYNIIPITWREKVILSLVPTDTSYSFKLNAPINWSVKIENNSDQALSGKIILELETYAGKFISKQELLVENGKLKMESENNRQLTLEGRNNNLLTANFQLSTFNFQLNPGFYHIKASFEDKNGLRKKEKSGFAVAPDSLKTISHIPSDLDSFWLRTLADLAAVPMQSNLKILPKLSTESLDVYLVEMHSLDNVLIRGYYAQPKNKTNLPVIIHYQGYSSVMETFGLRSDVAQFFLNIRGHGNSKDDVNPGFPGYFLSGIADPEKYIYRGAYSDAVRAIDFVLQRSEIDTSRIAVMGGSQGGALSLATAALDKRVALCAADVPFLSDFRNYFQIANWPGNEVKAYSFMHFKSQEEIYKTLDYFDISHLTPRITCPVFMGVGLYDDVCPPAINFAAYNNLSSVDKQYVLYPKSGHALPSEQYDLKMNWIRERFGF